MLTDSTISCACRPTSPGYCSTATRAALLTRANGSFIRLELQHIQKVLHRGAHIVEASPCNDASPMVFDVGDPIAGVVERLPAAGGGEDQLGTPIGRIGLSLEVT